MRRFTDLFAQLDAARHADEKVSAVKSYFTNVPEDDAIWALHFLMRGCRKRTVSIDKLRSWASAEAGLPDWLLEDSNNSVSDWAETTALVLPEPPQLSTIPLHELVESYVVADRARIVEAWRMLSALERTLYNKLLLGTYRSGVREGLIIRALSEITGQPAPAVAERFAQEWSPADISLNVLLAGVSAATTSETHDFSPHMEFTGREDSLGDINEWLVEWDYTGERAQLTRRGERSLIWSETQETVSSSLPELTIAVRKLPDNTVVTGTIVRGPGATFIANDVVEMNGDSVRDRPAQERKAILESLVNECNIAALRNAPVFEVASWSQLHALREQARENRARGLLLTRKVDAYNAGSLAWRTDPHVLVAVLMYAQRGQGDLASVYSEYTFGVWDGDSLVPIAKTNAGITDAEMRRLDNYVRRNAVEKFGPVRSVKPLFVYDIGFDSIVSSARHRSGVVLHNARVMRRREDLAPERASTLDAVRSHLHGEDRS